jgi:hypothetical protein
MQRRIAIITISRRVVIDLEAYSLGSASYPTEIGWAIINDNNSMISGACLNPTGREMAHVPKPLEPDAER